MAGYFRMGVLAIAVGIFMRVIQPPDAVPQVTCSEFPLLCLDEIAEGEPSVGQFGRWKKPLADLTFLDNLRNIYSRAFQLKSWSYLSVATTKYYIAITPVQFNYIEDVYFSVINRELKSSVFEYHWQMPLGPRLKISPSSISGCTEFASSRSMFSICFEDDSWLWKIDLSNEKSSFKADLRILKGAESLILSYPLGAESTRPAYVHKEAGMQAKGVVSLNNGPSEAVAGSATIDWTKAFCLRETRWRWVSFSGAACSFTVNGGRRITGHVGINLSNLVYDVKFKNSKLVSSENALWIDHKVYPLNMEANVTIPNDVQSNWVIRGGSDSISIDLQFVPHGSRQDYSGHEFLLPVLSSFVQPYGCFSGVILFTDVEGNIYNISVNDEYGVVENHRAIW